jgi:hypothetical protein
LSRGSRIPAALLALAAGALASPRATAREAPARVVLSAPAPPARLQRPDTQALLQALADRKPERVARLMAHGDFDVDGVGEAGPLEGMSVLGMAVRTGRVPVALELLARGADPAAPCLTLPGQYESAHGTFPGRRPFVWASGPEDGAPGAWQGRGERSARGGRKPILVPEPVPVLVQAVWSRQTLVVRQLLVAGARVDTKDPTFGTLLNAALVMGDLDLALCLARAGIRLEGRVAVHSGSAPEAVVRTVQLAAVCLPPGDAATFLRWLVLEGRIRTDLDGLDGRPLLFRAIDLQDEALVRNMLASGVPVDVMDRQGTTALVHSAAGGLPNPMTRLLLARGAQVPPVLDLARKAAMEHDFGNAARWLHLFQALELNDAPGFDEVLALFERERPAAARELRDLRARRARAAAEARASARAAAAAEARAASKGGTAAVARGLAEARLVAEAGARAATRARADAGAKADPTARPR